MMLALFVYMIGFFNSVKILAFCATILLIIATLFCLIATNSPYQKEVSTAVGFAKKAFTLLCVFSGALVIVRSEKTMWMMAAGYATQNVYESEAGDRVRRIINLKLDQYVEELAKETVKSSTK
jgi:hypothetical protein